jgi:hypothetical protein
MSRVWGVLGAAFSATGTEMAIRNIVSWPTAGRYLGGAHLLIRGKGAPMVFEQGDLVEDVQDRRLPLVPCTLAASMIP